MSALEIWVLLLPIQKKVMGKTVHLKRSSLVGSYPNLQVKFKEFQVLLVVRGLWVISYGDPTATSFPTSVSHGALKEGKRDQQLSQSRDITEVPPVVLLPAHNLPFHSRGFHSWFSTVLLANVCTSVSDSAAGWGNGKNGENIFCSVAKLRWGILYLLFFFFPMQWGKHVNKVRIFRNYSENKQEQHNWKNRAIKGNPNPGHNWEKPQKAGTNTTTLMGKGDISKGIINEKLTYNF